MKRDVAIVLIGLLVGIPVAGEGAFRVAVDPVRLREERTMTRCNWGTVGCVRVHPDDGAFCLRPRPCDAGSAGAGDDVICSLCGNQIVEDNQMCTRDVAPCVPVRR